MRFEILTMLLTAFPISDKAFFLGSLRDHIDSIENFQSKQLLVGNTLEKDIYAVYIHDKRAIYIRLETHRLDHTRGSHKQTLLSILLHKMLHALIEILCVDALSPLTKCDRRKYLVCQDTAHAGAAQWTQLLKPTRETSLEY